MVKVRYGREDKGSELWNDGMDEEECFEMVWL